MNTCECCGKEIKSFMGPNWKGEIVELTPLVCEDEKCKNKFWTEVDLVHLQLKEAI